MKCSTNELQLKLACKQAPNSIGSLSPDPVSILSLLREYGKSKSDDCSTYGVSVVCFSLIFNSEENITMSTSSKIFKESWLEDAHAPGRRTDFP